jgi:hypothetical protein
MKSLSMVVAVGALLVVASAPAQNARKVSFVLKSTGTEELPRTTVSIRVGSRVVMLKAVTGNPEVVTESTSWNKGSILSLNSWWAGQGDQFVVHRKGRNVLVYHRDLQEESEPGKFKLIQTIRG